MGEGGGEGSFSSTGFGSLKVQTKLNMKRIFSSSSSAEVGLLASRLENAGIPCEVRNESLSQVIPGIAFEPELWILNDEDYPEASELLTPPADPTLPESSEKVGPQSS